MLRPQTLGPALRRVDRVLMISSANPQLVAMQQVFIEAARAAGADYIVKFSGLNAGPDSRFRFARMHGQVERYLEKSGLDWAHLRPSQFMQTYFRETPTIATEGKFYLPMADARIAPVDVADIAAACYALLRDDKYAGHAYEMTGPQAVTTTNVAAALSAAIGKTVEYVAIDPAEKTPSLLTGERSVHRQPGREHLGTVRGPSRQDPHRPASGLR
jgi:uncharacterized protein YbjT (DUF2867 family)